MLTSEIIEDLSKLDTKEEIINKLREIFIPPPYSEKDYEDAKKQGLDLDDWRDYQEYYGLGEEEEYY